MGEFWDVFLGIFIGALCGVIPFVYGLISHHNALAIVAIVATIISGVIFVIFDKPPFTAIGVAIIFLVFLFAKNKNKHYKDNEDHEEYLNDE